MKERKVRQPKGPFSFVAVRTASFSEWGGRFQPHVAAGIGSPYRGLESEGEALKSPARQLRLSSN